MNIKQTTLTSTKRIVGYAAAVEKQHAPEQIGALWATAAASPLFATDSPKFSVYHEYEDKLASQYRVLVGVESDAPVPDGMTSVEVPAGDYAVAEATGAPAETAQALWTHVWTRWEGRSRRRFAVDFECHSGPPDATCVAVHLSMQE